MSLAHIQMVNMFSNPDPHNAAIHAMLMQLYPAFAKKVFEGSGLIGKLVRIGYDSADVLDFPICGRCESLAAYTDSYFKKGADGQMYEIPRCGCLKDGCGHITNNPTTFREWIKDEIRHKAPKSLIDELDDMIDFATDMFGRQMMSKAESDLME
ncbi:hypothetical protein EOL96_08845, partial [Candidatus Saccharibacteria bacterium]|nr:hypothetical protein [Candidatus Saccharibacteria bacterium]